MTALIEKGQLVKGQPRNRGGRPALQPHQRRRNGIKINVTDAQLARYQASASELDMKVSDYLISIADGGGGASVRYHPAPVAEMERIGTKLSHILIELRESGDAPEMEAEISNTLRKLERVMALFLADVGD